MTTVDRFWLHIAAARDHHWGKRHRAAQNRAREACLFAEEECVISGVFGDSNRTWLARLDFARNILRITLGVPAQPTP